MFAYISSLWTRFVRWLRPEEEKPVPAAGRWDARQTVWLEDCKNIKMPKLVRQKRLRLPLRSPHRYNQYSA